MAAMRSAGVIVKGATLCTVGWTRFTAARSSFAIVRTILLQPHQLGLRFLLLRR
jgi:hypothetical protein